MKGPRNKRDNKTDKSCGVILEGRDWDSARHTFRIMCQEIDVWINTFGKMMKFKSTLGRFSVSCHTVEWVHRYFFVEMCHKGPASTHLRYFLCTLSWRRLRLFVLSSAFKRKLSLWNKFKFLNVQTRRFFIDFTTKNSQGLPGARNFAGKVSGIAQEMEKNDNKKRRSF